MFQCVYSQAWRFFFGSLDRFKIFRRIHFSQSWRDLSTLYGPTASLEILSHNFALCSKSLHSPHTLDAPFWFFLAPMRLWRTVTSLSGGIGQQTLYLGVSTHQGLSFCAIFSVANLPWKKLWVLEEKNYDFQNFAPVSILIKRKNIQTPLSRKKNKIFQNY